MRVTQDEDIIRQAVYLRDNEQHLHILAGMESLFIRFAITMLRQGERSWTLSPTTPSIWT